MALGFHDRTAPLDVVTYKNCILEAFFKNTVSTMYTEEIIIIHPNKTTTTKKTKLALMLINL